MKIEDQPPGPLADHLLHGVAGLFIGLLLELGQPEIADVVFNKSLLDIGILGTVMFFITLIAVRRCEYDSI